MNSAKFLVLAMEAFKDRKFEEAGSLFAQAVECADSPELVGQLLQSTDLHVSKSSELNATSDSDSDSDDARELSVSNAKRRTESSSKIKQMIAAAMEATAEDENADSDSDFDDNLDTNPDAIPEFDPNEPGAKLLPVSFSHQDTVSPVRVKSC